MISDSELKQQLENRKEIINYVKNNFNSFVIRAGNAAIKKYSTRCDGIGKLNPSMIIYSRDNGLKKGRFIKEKGENTDYCIFESDKDNNPLRIRKYNKFGCESTFYFYTKDNTTYAVSFFKDTQEVYKYIYTYTIVDGRLYECSQIEETGVVLEKYDYTSEKDGIIKCDWCSYHDFSYSQNKNIKDNMSLFFTEKLKSHIIDDNIKIPTNQSPPKREDYQYLINNAGTKEYYISEYKLCNGEYKKTRELRK
ncbi:MAG: hypothetical protein Q4F95_16245 [Oscillospiraceae bacterium]|nr:hypothetical protein [Oscillospiraceae bacterium]